MEELILNNKGIVYHVVDKKFEWYHHYNQAIRDDLISEGMLMLVQSAQNFNETVGVKFSTFAYKHVLWGLHNFIKKERYGTRYRKTINELKDIEVMSYDNDITGTNTLIEICGQNEDEEIPLMEFWEIVNKSGIKDIKKIIRYREEGYSYREIGRKLGVSHESVSIRLRQLKECLAPYYNTEGYRGINMRKKWGEK